MLSFMRTSEATSRTAAGVSRYLPTATIAVALALTTLTSGLPAQGRGGMGVSVTVFSFASSTTITGAAFSAQRRRGATSLDLRARLSIRSQSAYSLRLRTEADSASIPEGAVMVKGGDGHFERMAAGASLTLASAAGSGDIRSLDLVLRVDASRSTGPLVAELVAARLDQ